ncbi:MAG: 3-oxoacyl-[acyl-carrier protein] reductase [uncultured Solirubrobacteraceae bacterium]|uniref:3-oxoacyl-[acyl-carrier protein] reductase n=1 Tax=uncultured Solirubrobacteraceae bacterium TaxID=1162706 RepID=A0A6J4TXE3_9ACTN|nr:MAG: 3-oxoacyl-[acyl-carrier protein] reductase [uncultured Solirubrobacteraceae bacterium]
MKVSSTKTAIITGGTKGVGRGIADRFAGLGMNLVVAYDRDDAAAQAAAEELQRGGATVLLVKADITERAQVEALFSRALAEFGQIDVVMANAGVEVIDRTFADLEEARMDRVVDLNVKGTFFTLQQAARHVADGGRIVVTASTIALYPPEKAGVYAATKAATRTMVEVLAKELGPRRVTVNSLAPGMVKAAGVFTGIPADLEAQAVGATPLGRMVVPADVGGAAAFLVSDDAAMITGQHLGITGGAVQ